MAFFFDFKANLTSGVAAMADLSTLMRLFDLIEKASFETQVDLIKRIHKDQLGRCLHKLVLDLNEEQQMALLNDLNQIHEVEHTETTLDLDERLATRKKCYIMVNYAVDDKTFEENILDISTLGVFIETLEPMGVGQIIRMRFALPGHQETMEIRGQIVWTGDRGVGVKFMELAPKIFEKLRHYIGLMG